MFSLFSITLIVEFPFFHDIIEFYKLSLIYYFENYNFEATV